MTLNDTWFAAEGGDDDEMPFQLRGRQFLLNFIEAGKYIHYVEATWSFQTETDNGLPTGVENDLMGEVENSLLAALEADFQTVLTIVHTGDNERTWIFYTKSVKEFLRRFNEAVKPYGKLPVSIDTDEDPDWETYRHILLDLDIELG